MHQYNFCDGLKTPLPPRSTEWGAIHTWKCSHCLCTSNSLVGKPYFQCGPLHLDRSTDLRSDGRGGGRDRRRRSQQCVLGGHLVQLRYRRRSTVAAVRFPLCRYLLHRSPYSSLAVLGPFLCCSAVRVVRVCLPLLAADPDPPWLHACVRPCL